LELIYDDSRALTTGKAPDFEAYWTKLNSTLKTGSITVGQRRAWKALEDEKEGGRKNHYGNPGPDKISKVAEYKPRSKKCLYAWERSRQTYTAEANEKGPIRCTASLDAEDVFNISAYKPGDFKQFFDDPRTRANYLQWAPFMLEAEEFHAGNRAVKDIPPEKPKSEPSWEAQRRYQLRKVAKALHKKAVRNTYKLSTKAGDAFEKGTLWRAYHERGVNFRIERINEDGTDLVPDETDKRTCYMIGVRRDSLREDSSIPPRPVKPKETEEE
jgi:hypothetical protein